MQILLQSSEKVDYSTNRQIQKDTEKCVWLCLLNFCIPK
jgi:hypothetical protein